MRVAVVGLGLGGLTAARTLARAGAEVVGFDSRPAPGGRVRNEPLGDGFWEAGGEWIDSDHLRVQDLLKEFGLDPIPASDLPSAIHYEGSLILDGAWPDVAKEEARLEAEANRRAAALADPIWTEESQVGLDHVPLRAFVDSIVTSPRGRWLATARLRSDEGEDLERVGTLGWLAGWRNYLGRDENAMSALRSPIGLWGLAENLLWTLEAELRFQIPIEQIEIEGDHVRVDGERFDSVVIAIPPRAVERLRFVQPLPAATRCAIEGIGAARAVKIGMRFKNPFWLERGLSGRVLTDGPLQQLWAGPRPEEGLLYAYAVGDRARAWSVLQDPVAAARYEIGQIFPEAPDLYVEGAFADWTTENGRDGAFPYLPPGYVTAHLQALGQPVGPIHWAGDWCAAWTGFAEGALESGERAATEILNG